MKAVILNACLQTFGGGERLAYAMATGLSALGMRVTVLTTEPTLPTLDEIHAFYGPGFHGFSLRRCAKDDLPRVLAEHDLMVNHTAGDCTVNPCRLGVYLVMFPFQERGPFLRTYDRYWCISDYTTRHTRARWNVETELLYPAAHMLAASGPRERRIVMLGRFNRAGHDKNQERFLSIFERFLAAHPGWSLALIGRKNSGDDPLPAIRARIGTLPVTLHVDVSEDEKKRLLATSSLYWHGAGFGLSEERDPERLEHFGIAVVEAMSAGLVPLVYGYGGPAEIVEHGHSGYHYASEEALLTLTDLAAERAEHGMRDAAITRSRCFDAAAFATALGERVRGFA